MKLKYNNQIVDLFNKEDFPKGPPKKIVLSLSGGCDSSSLAFLIAKYFPNIDIHPFNSKDEDSLIDTECAINVHKFLRDKFSNIKDLELFDVKTTDPKWMKIGEEAREKHKIMVNGKLEYKWRNVKGASKALQNRLIREKMSKKYDTIVATGMSCNPPIQIMKDRGFYDVAERKRDPGDFESLSVFDIGPTFITYTPYIFTDKKFVAGVFKEHNLLNTLLPLTKSCAWSSTLEVCNKCFWCNERKWAFE